MPPKKEERKVLEPLFTIPENVIWWNYKQYSQEE
jgi:hypothetical protein